MTDTKTVLPASTGKTIQVLAFHPIFPNTILWVHNIQEKVSAFIKRYDGKPKPSGWGNGGGGLESNELELLAKYDPEHPLFSYQLADEDKTIIACGLRELRDESGYYDINIDIPEDGQYRLLTYTYRDERGNEEHQVITLGGGLQSLSRRPIVETNEIDIVDWFDVTQSLPEQFFDQVKRPERPYWSHVRRTLLGIQQLDYRKRDEFGDRYAMLRDRVHPSWRFVFPIGKGDERFPKNGYPMPPAKWYELFEEMVKEKIEMVDRDFIFNKFSNAIIEACEREQYLDQSAVISSTPAEKVDDASVPVDDSEDAGLPVPLQVLKEENELWMRHHNEEWREWSERAYGI